VKFKTVKSTIADVIDPSATPAAND